MSRTVLVVEDGDQAAPLEIALARLDQVSVLVAWDGREALRLIQSLSLELAALVTDLHLPFVDGFELVEGVRLQPRYASLPVIVISGDTHPDTAGRLEQLGTNAFFPKPYSPAAICQSLEDLWHAQ
ncbi:MAG: response regulator [Acidobacteriota bacterium]|nr:response regulator [Acidobacteriota bacterium]